MNNSIFLKMEKKQNLYNNSGWRRLRLAILERDGFICQACKKPIIRRHKDWHGVVDHIDPHKGDETKFWDESNLQTLHKKCHDIKTASENYHRMTADYGTQPNGWPVGYEES